MDPPGTEIPFSGQVGGLDILPIPTAVIVLDSSARVVYSNAACLRYLYPERIIEKGTIPTEEEVNKLRQGWSDLAGKKLSPSQEPALRVSMGEAFSQLELMWVSPDTGRAFYALLNGGPIPTTPYSKQFGLVTFVDITAEIQQREQLKQTLRMRDDFISVASHELRTPLMSVFLQTKALIRSTLSGEVIPRDKLVHQLDVLDRGITRMSTLVDNLLVVSEITSPSDLKLRNLDFCQIVREAVSRFEPIALHQNVPIHSTIPKQEIRGNWDGDKLDQIIENLLSNALKYGESHPIDVTVTPKVGLVELKIRDYGIGVSAENRLKIFQKYERAVSIHSYGGLGLGLWLASEAARVFGGSLWVEDPPGAARGSVFVLHLPITTL